MLHILSSRQGFALSPSVALTAGSAPLPLEYKQTSPLHDRNLFQAAFSTPPLFLFPYAGSSRGLQESGEWGISSLTPSLPGAGSSQQGRCSRGWGGLQSNSEL